VQKARVNLKFLKFTRSFLSFMAWLFWQLPHAGRHAFKMWVIQWVKPVCGSSDLSGAMTCPCIGFAYGEQGQLSLERTRSGVFVESMNLSTLFGESDNPADIGNAALRLRTRNENDPSDEVDDPGSKLRFDAEVLLRPPTDVMDVQDFSKDGMKSTFLLQIGNAPCGKRDMVLIGVSKILPRLHAFTTTAHPERPLVLQAHEWMALIKTGGQVTVTDWTCGDHGSEVEIEKNILAKQGNFEVKSNTYSCQKNGSRGLLLQSEEQ
jgi:hypothetical protein